MSRPQGSVAGGISCQMLYDRYKSLPRFAIVGCINTGVDFAVFFLLNLVGVNYLICQVVAYVTGLINSFIMNKLWSFENKISELSTFTQFIKFICVNLCSLAVSLIALQILNSYQGLSVFSSKVVVTVFLTQFINYFGYRFWVFNRKAGKVGVFW